MVLVLVIVVVAALLSTAFLSKSGAELRAGATLQTHVRLGYGADAGLEQGTASLEAELLSATRKHCLTPFGPPQSVFLPFSWSASGYSVSVTCQDLQGYAADDTGKGLYGAAIVVTGGAHSLTTQSAVNNSLDVGGTIYLSGAEDSGDLKKNVNLTRGDLAQFGCSGSPGISQISVASPYSQYCTTLTPSQVAASVALPAIPTTAPAPVLLPGNKCQVFFPGKYTSAPALINGNNTSNYFASGDYYFDGNFAINLANKTEVVAGAKSTGDVDPAGVTPCSNDNAAKLLAPTAAINGTGAAFYMGQASSINIAQGTLAMYSRPVTVGTDIPLNIYAIRSTDSGWDAWTGGSTPVVGISNPNATMLFNGQINAYDAPVQVFASNPTYAAVRAGVVAKTLDLQASASGTNLDISGYGTGSTVGSRIVRLTATAAGTAGDPGGATGTAVVRFYNDTTKAPQVLSWRFS